MRSYDVLSIPEYYFNEGYLDKRIKAVPSSKKQFLFVTDVHCDAANARRSLALISYVTNKSGLKM